jgi:serine/threonine protein kinase
MFEIGRALLHLQKNGIIHRDVKAKNIFITQDNTFKLGLFIHSTVLLYFYIGDFSIARIPGLATRTVGVAGTEFDLY